LLNRTHIIKVNNYSLDRHLSQIKVGNLWPLVIDFPNSQSSITIFMIVY
jgi:hypothetical protein